MFAFMLDGESLREGALLVGSLRAFGGAMKDLPVLCMVPGGADTLPLAEREKFVAYGCDFASFEPDERTAGLPFATKVSAAAEAERLSRGKADILVWLDHDTVFAREPSELRLPPGALIGARPVHHRLIGPLWDGDPDQYWAAVYRVCGADRGGDFPMTTIMDREVVRPYLNTGLLAVRLEAGILQAWLRNFISACTDGVMMDLVSGAAGGMRAIFLHQAVLAATVVSGIGAGGFFELSFGYNYPIHLHGSCPSVLAPRKLNDAFMLRYDQWSMAPGSDNDAIDIPEYMRDILAGLR